MSIKTSRELEIMAGGGQKLAQIKDELKKLIVVGKTAADIEARAVELIAESGGQASFKMVPGYKHATCVNINSGLVHGIPTADVVFRTGDLVSVDIGLYYEGFHTDSSFSVAIDSDKKTGRFLICGQKALEAAIGAAIPGGYIFDISAAMERVIRNSGFRPVRALVGHGVGRKLHEEPSIPCFTDDQERKNSPKIVFGMALAIEVMYTLGSEELEISPDGWTISTCDGKISALFEETVAILPTGPRILT